MDESSVGVPEGCFGCRWMKGVDDGEKSGCEQDAAEGRMWMRGGDTDKEMDEVWLSTCGLEMRVIGNCVWMRDVDV